MPDRSLSVSGLLKTGEMLEFESQRVTVDASAGVEPSSIQFFDLRAEMTVMQLYYTETLDQLKPIPTW